MPHRRKAHYIENNIEYKQCWGFCMTWKTLDNFSYDEYTWDKLNTMCEDCEKLHRRKMNAMEYWKKIHAIACEIINSDDAEKYRRQHGISGNSNMTECTYCNRYFLFENIKISLGRHWGVCFDCFDIYEWEQKIIREIEEMRYRKEEEGRKKDAEFMRKYSNKYKNKQKRNKLRHAALEFWNDECSKQVLELFDNSCPYCGAINKLQLEHWIPINKGGKTEPGNCYYACKYCNGGKSDKMPLDWLIERFGEEKGTDKYNKIVFILEKHAKMMKQA